MVKRYVAEPGSDLVRTTMDRADAWFMCRVGFVETLRAVTLVAGRRAAQAMQEEWPSLGVVELDQSLAEEAARLAIARQLGSLDALHLAAALVLPSDDLLFTTWDRPLHAAAVTEGLDLVPEALD